MVLVGLALNHRKTLLEFQNISLALQLPVISCDAVIALAKGNVCGHFLNGKS